MRFRAATTGDLEAVLAIIARADEQSGDWAPGGRPHAPSADYDRARISSMLAGDASYNEVAEADGSVVGFVNGHPRGEVVHISYLFVDPDHQGRGIGTQMLEHAVEAAARNGHRRATLNTAVLNRRARDFYERAGWIDTGGRSHNAEIGLEMADYALELAPQ